MKHGKRKKGTKGRWDKYKSKIKMEYLTQLEQ